ncbi:ATP-binding protein [Roseibium denhamense]
MVLLSLTGVIMMSAAALGGFLLQQSFDKSPTVMMTFVNAMTIAKLNETPALERPAILAALKSGNTELDLEPVPSGSLPDRGLKASKRRHGPFALGEVLPGIELVHVEGRRGTPHYLYFRLQDGDLVRAVWNRSGEPLPPGPWRSIIFVCVFVALAFTGLMLWAIRGVVRPMEDLASAAEDFAKQGAEPVPVSISGPEEIRTAGEAFNRMQLQIQDFVSKQRRTLAAISHDLRTPLTRLRLRLDLLEEGEIRDRSLADLDLMDQQITQALAFLKGGNSSEPLVRTDAASLLQAVVDKYSETGLTVQLECETGLAIMVHVNDFIRALSNLIDNANHYADGADISLSSMDGFCQIDVRDHGPGIADEDKARLLEPFERGDLARQVRQGTGFGLGLATTNAIVEAIGGSVELLDTKGGGLTVRLRLPLAKAT